jgi:adenylate cyclase
LVSALSAAVLASLLSYLTFLENVEFSLLDMRFRLRGPKEKCEDIVVVAIDQTSESDLDQPYPWSRRLHARLIDNLTRAEARLIVFDVVFTEGRDPDATAELAAAIRRAGNVILAGKTLLSRTHARATTILPPVDELADACWGWGLVDQYSDSDNAVRRYGTSTTFGDRQYATLALQTLKASQGLRPDAPVEQTPKKARVGAYEIPKHDRQTMLINYCGPARSFPQYSYSNVLDDASFDLPRAEADTDIFDYWAETDVFRQKIVLVGYTAQELHDFILTPFFGYGGEKVLTPGVEMHANALSTILAGDYIYRPAQASFWFRPFLALLWAFLACFAAARVGIFPGLALVLGLAAGEAVLAFWLFEAQGWWLDITAPVLSTGLAYSAQTTWFYVAEQKDKRMIRGMFSKYVPSRVVDEIIRNPELLTLGGEERELTVLFSDIESFTTISEGLTPRELADHLNDYLTAMSQIILDHQGIIDKFEGDAIMAEFGAPVFFEEHARRACFAALESQTKLSELGERWEKEGLHAWKARIGIHTGDMIVGNMGSRELFDYTVLGDNVNLGARLEASNKIYGTRIMISEATLSQAGEGFIVRELDDLVVRGRTQPVKVFELVGTREDGVSQQVERVLAAYERGRAAAAAEKWREALSAFEEALAVDPEDGPSVYHRSKVEDRLRA